MHMILQRAFICIEPPKTPTKEKYVSSRIEEFVSFYSMRFSISNKSSFDHMIL